MTQGKGESVRKPIRPDLPSELRLLLTELEVVADQAGLSFTKILKEIAQDGERLHPSHVTRWRAGSAFPSEQTVKRWTEICHGDVRRTVGHYPAAKDAFVLWRSSGGGRDDPPVDRKPTTRPGRRWNRRWSTVGLVGALVAVGAIVFVSASPGRRPVDQGPRPCSWWWDGAETMSTAPIGSPGPEAPFMYKVPSGVGSEDVPVTHGGSAVQPFLATAPQINRVSVIIGLDPRRTNPRRPHRIRFEILEHTEGHRPLLLGTTYTAVTSENDNKDVVADFAPPVGVTVDRSYALRVSNESGDPIGLYVNSPQGQDRRVPLAADVCVADALEPFDPTGKVLSGSVSGRR